MRVNVYVRLKMFYMCMCLCDCVFLRARMCVCLGVFGWVFIYVFEFEFTVYTVLSDYVEVAVYATLDIVYTYCVFRLVYASHQDRVGQTHWCALACVCVCVCVCLHVLFRSFSNAYDIT
jgi:hypothetical protein